MTEQDLKPWDAAYTDAYGPTYSTKKAPALSRVPRGHWRNTFRITGLTDASQGEWADGVWEHLGGEYWRDPDKFVSREMAEQGMLETLAAYKNAPNHFYEPTWIDSEFFPIT